MKVHNLLKIAKETLKQNPHIKSYDLDADLIVAYATGIKSREELLLNFDKEISFSEVSRCQELLEARIQDKPIAYLFQRKEFWSYNFAVNDTVLIPRPDTELIIEIALKHFDTQAKIEILDLGTGSGCLAVTLAKLYENAHVVAVDISQDALVTASQNAARLGVLKRIELLESDWFEAIMLRKFDMIVCNPPYISAHEWAQLEATVRNYEPRQALTDDKDGLSCYQKIFGSIEDHLNANSIAIFECGYNQSSALLALAAQHQLRVLSLHKDLAGIPRCLVIKK